MVVLFRHFRFWIRVNLYSSVSSCVVASSLHDKIREYTCQSVAWAPVLNKLFQDWPLRLKIDKPPACHRQAFFVGQCSFSCHFHSATHCVYSQLAISDLHCTACHDGETRNQIDYTTLRDCVECDINSFSTDWQLQEVVKCSQILKISTDLYIGLNVRAPWPISSY